MNYYLFKFSKVEDCFYYTFRTDNELEYIVQFKTSFLFPFDDSFQISIANHLSLSNSKMYDAKIATTIIAIIQNFLDLDGQRSIYYICDSSNGLVRGQSRLKLFSRWFEANNNSQEYCQKQSKFVKNNDIYYTGLIYSIYHNDSRYLNLFFDTINQELNK